MDEELGRTAQSTPASVRRELWRDTQQQSVGSIEEYNHLDTSDNRYDSHVLMYYYNIISTLNIR